MRGAVDEAQQHAPARLDLDKLGIGERAVVGEEGVIFDVVEVGAAAAAPFCIFDILDIGAGARRPPPAILAGLFQPLEYLLGGREAEIGEHDHDLLLVRAVALIPDDERRGHQPLLLQALMGVHPERAAEAQREIVIGAAAWEELGVRKCPARRLAARAG